MPAGQSLAAATSAPSRATVVASSSRPKTSSSPARAVNAGEVVDLADRLGDPARRPELLDASLEVAEEGQIHTQRPPGVAFLDGRVDLAGDRDGLLAQHARVAIAGLDHERFAERGQHPRPLGRRWRGGTSATACSYSAIAPWPPVAAR